MKSYPKSKQAKRTPKAKRAGKKYPSKKRTKSERKLLEKELWDLTAIYVKARDKVCVTCGTDQKLTLSHYIKCGKQRIRYDLRNCNAQCSPCNNLHNYYPHIYEGYMRHKYGNDVLDELEELAKVKLWKWSVIELREMVAEMEARLASL